MTVKWLKRLPVAASAALTLLLLVLNAPVDVQGGGSVCGDDKKIFLPEGAKWDSSCIWTDNNPAPASQACIATCNAGYSANGYTEIQCDVNSWGYYGTLNTLVCTPLTCTSSPDDTGLPENAAYHCSDNAAYGSVCSATCNAGYYAVGARTATCTQNIGMYSARAPDAHARKLLFSGAKWGAFNGNLKCLPVPPAPCVTPPGPDTSKLPMNAAWNCSSVTAHLGSCSAECKPGFTAYPSGSTLTTTCNYGAWDYYQGDLQCAADRCAAKDLAAVDLPANAVWDCNSPSRVRTRTANTMSCSAKCKAGYEAVGSYSIACSSGVWEKPTGTLECKVPADACLGEPPISPPDNAAWDCRSPSTAANGNCTATCASGYTASGSLYAPCLATNPAQWGAAVGDMTCTEAVIPDCTGTPGPTITNTPLHSWWDCPATTASGHSCSAACDDGYVSSGATSATCKAGVWQAPTGDLKCVRAPPPLNCSAFIVPPCVDTASGFPSDCKRSTADYYCKRNFGTTTRCQYNYKPSTVVCKELTGETCTGHMASCPVVRCLDPPPLPEGMRYYHGCRNVNVGDVCKAVCNTHKGYVGDGYTMECRASGDWGPREGTGCTKK